MKMIGTWYPPRRQALLQFHAAHAGHAHVEHQAAGLRGIVAVEKRLGRGEGLHLQPNGLDQPAQAAGNRLIIVNYEDCRLAHACAPAVR
jgi:hypothetical protein